jgi:putative membrane-bound dehydrogenase-like protein
MPTPALLLAVALALPGDDFPAPRDTGPETSGPRPAGEAAASFVLPEGFRVAVFAAEPDVRNPIAMAFDPKGRLWVAENYTYAERPTRFDLGLRDRVLIFEDADGDGRHDKRGVFLDDVQRLTSVELGRGGVWLMCPPQLLFVPDRDGDDTPDGPPEVLLDGFGVPPENYHTIANGLRWGPDGWLYGRCGASSISRVGTPGTPDDARVPLYGGLWRFHPGRKTFEVVAHGTTNPWGHDWDERGEALFINTVNGHLWHAVAGMHFARPHSIDPNPYTYELIDTHADHYHWDTREDWTASRAAGGEHDRLGGGHAHAGLMIYQGADWPEEYRGDLFTLNLHGRRINRDRLEREGTGLVGRHEPDFARAGDAWFRGIDLASGPDGGVYVLDWSDFGECHESDGVHRSSGRIYKITYGDEDSAGAADLAGVDERGLVALHDAGDVFPRRMARRLLADRASAGEPVEGAAGRLRERLGRREPAARREALWSLHAAGRIGRSELWRLLDDEDESLRAWAVRLLLDDRPLDDIFGRRPPGEPGMPGDLLERLITLAREDDSGLVRLALASSLQRLPHAQRPALAAALLARPEDAGDRNQPLLIWYGLMPLADSDPPALARLATADALPTTRRLIARRLAEAIAEHPGALDGLVARAADSGSAAFRADVLAGMAEGLKGRHRAEAPRSWPGLSARVADSTDAGTRARARDLGVLFGDGRALDEVRRLALDEGAPLDARRDALRTLIEARPPDLRAVCERLAGVRFLNVTAAKGLAQFDDPEIGRALARNYRAFHPSDRPAVVEVLTSRASFAAALLDAIASGAIPREDLSAFGARRVRGLGDPALAARLAEVWGAVRDPAGDRRAEADRLRARLTPEALASADATRGRRVFEKACGACHRLHGRGGDVGPDLTGSGRHDLGYLLENLTDPAAVVPADFRMVVVALEDGRVLNGIVRARTGRTLTLRTPEETLVLDLGDVERVEPSDASLMPEGLLAGLADEELRDLFAYLMSR